MNERPPIPADFRVENRSDRVFVYGFVRMMPFGMWFGGILVLAILSRLVTMHPVIWLVLTAMVLVVPIVVDRSLLLDPVDYVNFCGLHVMVKRLVSKKSHPLERILQIEFSSPAGEDYDDRGRGADTKEVVMRFRGGWPARFTAAQKDVAAIEVWARAFDVEITSPEITRIND